MAKPFIRNSVTNVGIEFDYWKGSINLFTNVGNQWSRIGQKGSNAQTVGLRAPPSTILTQLFYTADPSSAQQTRQAIADMQWQKVSCRNDFGQEYAELLCTFSNSYFKPISGMGYDYVLISTFILELQKI
jgi:hypothetical protein